MALTNGGYFTQELFEERLENFPPFANDFLSTIQGNVELRTRSHQAYKSPYGALGRINWRLVLLVLGLLLVAGTVLFFVLRARGSTVKMVTGGKK